MSHGNYKMTNNLKQFFFLKRQLKKMEGVTYYYVSVLIYSEFNADVFIFITFHLLIYPFYVKILNLFSLLYSIWIFCKHCLLFFTCKFKWILDWDVEKKNCCLHGQTVFLLPLQLYPFISFCYSLFWYLQVYNLPQNNGIQLI